MSNDLAILSSHLSTLIEARSVSPNELGPLVSYAIQETQDERSPDTRKVQWEVLLKGEVFRLAVSCLYVLIWNIDDLWYRQQKGTRSKTLILVITKSCGRDWTWCLPSQNMVRSYQATSHFSLSFFPGACDASFPHSVLEDLLETQTVSSCWHIFSWMEERTERLTAVRFTGQKFPTTY